MANQVVEWQPGMFIAKGTTVLVPGNPGSSGWHVTLRNVITDRNPPKINESGNDYHWSVGGS